ncbi:MAG: hypothetical protein WD004_02830 [Actinomycetota bacterium]
MRTAGVRIGAGLLLALAACSGIAPKPITPSYDDIEQAITGSGLLICASSVEGEGLAAGAIDARVFEVSANCETTPPSQVVVDRFADMTDRDAAADEFRVLSRPRGSGAVWTYGTFTIFAHGSTGHEAMRRLVDAMAGLGAT